MKAKKPVVRRKRKVSAYKTAENNSAIVVAQSIVGIAKTGKYIGSIISGAWLGGDIGLQIAKKLK
jgi:hypothetical protein